MQFEMTLRDAALDGEFLRDIEGFCTVKAQMPLLGTYLDVEPKRLYMLMVPEGGLRGVRLRMEHGKQGVALALDPLANLADFRLAAAIVLYLGARAPRIDFQGAALETPIPPAWWHEQARSWRARSFELVRTFEGEHFDVEWLGECVRYGPTELPRDEAAFSAFEQGLGNAATLVLGLGPSRIDYIKKDVPVIKAYIGDRVGRVPKDVTHIVYSEASLTTRPMPVAAALEVFAPNLSDIGKSYHVGKIRLDDLSPEARARLHEFLPGSPQPKATPAPAPSPARKPPAPADLGPEAREIVWEVLKSEYSFSKPDFSRFKDPRILGIGEKASRAVAGVMARILETGMPMPEDQTRALAEMLGIEAEIPALVQSVAIERRDELFPMVIKFARTVRAVQITVAVVAIAIGVRVLFWIFG